MKGPCFGLVASLTLFLQKTNRIEWSQWPDQLLRTGLCYASVAADTTPFIHSFVRVVMLSQGKRGLFEE